jgi:hypothetical protein
MMPLRFFPRLLRSSILLLLIVIPSAGRAEKLPSERAFYEEDPELVNPRKSP